MPPKRTPGRRPKNQPPDLCFYKPRQAACVYLGGKRRLLGPWGSPEARKAFAAVVAEWESQHRADRVFRPTGSVTVADFVAAFMTHAAVYYRHEDGKQTSEVSHFRVALAPLLEIGDRFISDLGYEDVREIVSGWMRAGWTRGYVNKMLGKIQRALRWGKRERLVPPSVVADVEDVPRLPKGRSTAPEPKPIVAADLRAVRAVLRHLAPDMRLIVLVQLRCGARPEEACRMHSGDIHEGEVTIDGRTFAIPPGATVFVPRRQKNRWRGKSAAYGIGPKLKRRLVGRTGFFFPGPKTPHVRRDYYDKKIAAACAKAGVEAWTPLQLRHLFLSRRRRQEGWEAARQSVMHGSISTTEIYVDREIRGMVEQAQRRG